MYQYAVSLENGEWFVSEGLKRNLTQVVMGIEGGSVSLTCDELVLPEESKEKSPVESVRENSVDSLSVMSISTSVGTEMEPVNCLEFEKEKPELIVSDVSLTPLSVSPDPLPVKSPVSSPSPLLPFASSSSIMSTTSSLPPAPLFASDSPSELCSPSSLLSKPCSASNTPSTSYSISDTPLSSLSEPRNNSSTKSHEFSSENPLSQQPPIYPPKEYEVGIALNDMIPIPTVSQHSEHPLVLTTRRSKQRPKETPHHSSVSATAAPFVYPSVMNYPVMGCMPPTPMMMCVMAPNGQLVWIQPPVQHFPMTMPENPSVGTSKLCVC